MRTTIDMPQPQQAPQQQPQAAAAGRRLRILSLTIEYPNPHHRGLGLFVRSRLQHMAAHTALTVISPVPLLDYSNPGHKLLPGDMPHQRADEAAEVYHPRWFYPPLGTPLNAFCLTLAVLPLARRLHREHRFDLLDAHFGFPDGVAAAMLAAALGVPFVVTQRGNEPIFAQSWIRRVFMRWSLRRAASVISVSEQLRQFAVSLGVDPARTRVIGNGVNARIFREQDRHECRRRHNIDPDAQVVLTAGSLIEAKGHHRALQAVAALRRKGLPARLVIAGSESKAGPGFGKTLREMAAQLELQPYVQFAGWVPPETLAELMSAADVFCLASDSEGWPNVVHEATSCGVPVVSTDVGSAREMVPGPDYGFIVPVGDQPELERALETVLTGKWDRQKIAAWGQSRSWEQVADDVLAVARQVLHVRD